MKRLSGKMPAWLQTIIVVICAFVGLFVILPLYGELFRSNMVLFFLIWIVIPILLVIFKSSIFSNKLNQSSAIKLRNIAFGMTVCISFAFLFSHDVIRDSIGYNYIKGYHSEYYPDVDEYGRDQTGVIIQTAKWYTRFILWLGEWGYLFLIFGIPFMTWQLGKRLVSVSVKSQNKAEL